MVAFQEVLDRLNDLFGSEDFSEGQKVSFEALLRTLLDDNDLVQQAKVNSANSLSSHRTSRMRSRVRSPITRAPTRR